MSVGIIPNLFSGSSEAQTIAALLVSREVQQVQFRLGYLRRTSNEWSKLAAALSMGVVKAKVDATAVSDAHEEAVGLYKIEQNCMYLSSGNFTSTARARGIVIHECSHAIRDMRGGKDAIRHDEAAAYISEGLYHLACGQTTDHGVPDELFEIATALHNRAPGRDGVPHATREEIILARRTVGKLGSTSQPYVNDYYYYDGV